MSQYATLPFTPLITGHDQATVGADIYRPHGLSDWLLIYTISGSGFFESAPGQLICRAGDVVLIAPETPQHYGVAPNADHWERYWTHFLPRPTWLERLIWPEISSGTMLITLLDDAKSSVEQSLEQMCKLSSGALARRSEFAMNALEAAILWIDTQNPRSPEAKFDERVRRCMEFICANYSGPITTSDLARIAGLSQSRILHLFREQVGKSPTQYLETQRIEQARQLLTVTRRTVGDIAEAVGYESPFYFTLRFKKVMGVAPTIYRDQLFGRLTSQQVHPEPSNNR